MPWWVYLLMFAGWMFGLSFVLVLAAMSANQDRAAKRQERDLFPLSDVTLTRTSAG